MHPNLKFPWFILNLKYFDDFTIQMTSTHTICILGFAYLYLHSKQHRSVSWWRGRGVLPARLFCQRGWYCRLSAVSLMFLAYLYGNVLFPRSPIHNHEQPFLGNQERRSYFRGSTCTINTVNSKISWCKVSYALYIISQTIGAIEIFLRKNIHRRLNLHIINIFNVWIVYFPENQRSKELASENKKTCLWKLFNFNKSLMVRK